MTDAKATRNSELVAVSTLYFVFKGNNTTATV